jgi:hypothetical protein
LTSILLQLALHDGELDWEIARNGALALSIASYEMQNHEDMIKDSTCVNMIIDMCCKVFIYMIMSICIST